MLKKSTVPVKYGLAIATGLVSYFLILSLLDLHVRPIFSLVNGLIMAYGIYQAIKHYKLEKGPAFEYEKGFFAGMFTGFNATLLFTGFFAIYATHLDPDFLPRLISSWMESYHTGISLVVFVVAIMGFATTLVLVLSYMQLFKESWNVKRQKRPIRMQKPIIENA